MSLCTRHVGRARRGFFPVALAAVLATAFVLSAASAVSARTLVTYEFAGDITKSSHANVKVGDRFTGTFTYDLDEPDRDTRNPEYGSYLYDLPEDQPVGMTYAVGSVVYSTDEFVEVFVVNDSPNGGHDEFFFASDSRPTPGLPPVDGGVVDLADTTGMALSSDRPPAVLDLSQFNIRKFSGVDIDPVFGGFEGTIDTLRLVPEPSGAAVAGLGAVALLGRHPGRRRRPR